MQLLMEHQAAFWLALGFLLLVIEALAFGFSSGLLLFGSLGAIITGALIGFSVVPNNFIVAVACFAVSTAGVTAVLWVPLKKLQSGADLGNDRSSDIIGHAFVLATDISATVPGEQKYSGIHWRVEPSSELAAPVIGAGTRVEVTAVGVGVFSVKPVATLEAT